MNNKVRDCRKTKRIANDCNIDLHIHSTASDGSLSPARLVDLALSSGLYAVALTDHDTVDGIPEFAEAGKKAGLRVIPGLEISVDFKTEMHILGYFCLDSYTGIENTLTSLKKHRRDRNPKIIARLNELGYKISLEEADKEAGGDVVGRLHIAKVLVRRGHAGSVDDAFERLLSAGKPAYFKKEKLSPQEGIEAIASSGGVPVLAHPLLLRMDMHKLDELLCCLGHAGLVGIEAYYPDHTRTDTGNLLRLARKHNLLATGGSDFHGGFKPDIKMGKGRGSLKVPCSLLDRLDAALKQRTPSY